VEQVFLVCGRLNAQLMRDSLGSAVTQTVMIRHLSLALAATLAIPPALTVAQAASGDSTLTHRMQAYVSARQFRDIQGIRLLVPDSLYNALKDGLAAKYREFRASYPGAALSPDSSEFKAFFRANTDTEVLSGLAKAFESIEGGSPDNAALIVFAGEYFPPDNWVIDSARYSFARYEGPIGVFYLTEFVRIPYANVAFPARSVVRWVRVNGRWSLAVTQ
jgi:hypothetical protein